MTENNNADARKRHISTPNPAAVGEAGQFVTGDYGDAGTVDAGAADTGSGEYAEGDYGEAGTVDTGVAAKGHGEYAEGDHGDSGTAHQGSTADDTEGGARRD